jgi:hypothetical protein
MLIMKVDAVCSSSRQIYRHAQLLRIWQADKTFIARKCDIKLLFWLRRVILFRHLPIQVAGPAPWHYSLMNKFQAILRYCTISTVSSVTRNGQKKSPCFKLLELKRKFIGHLGQQIFRIRELTVEMVRVTARKKALALNH